MQSEFCIEIHCQYSILAVLGVSPKFCIEMELTWRISLVLLSLLLLESICKDVSGFQCTSDEVGTTTCNLYNLIAIRLM